MALTHLSKNQCDVLFLQLGGIDTVIKQFDVSFFQIDWLSNLLYFLAVAATPPPLLLGLFEDFDLGVGAVQLKRKAKQLHELTTDLLVL